MSQRSECLTDQVVLTHPRTDKILTRERQDDMSNTPMNPLTGRPADFADLGELTPTEENQIQAAMLAAQRRHAEKPITPGEEERHWDAFALELRNRCAEIGFVIHIEWEEYEVEGLSGRAAVPNVTVIGRTAKKETDHELISDELGRGLDGRPGYIREDGSWSLDKIKKTIL